MKKPEHHIFVCASFRTNGTLQGVCHKKGSLQLLSHLENEISEHGLSIMLSSTGCLKACDKGPIMIIYPEGYWYGNIVSTEDVDTILDCLETGEIAKRYLI